jgi:AP-4 complex subunit epsilon-1
VFSCVQTQLKNAVDEFFRGDLVARITQAAERFAPSNSWYIQTMIQVFELGGDLVRPDVAQNLVRLIAEGGGESEEVDAALRREAVEALLTQIDKPALPDILLQVMFWVLGEYGYLSGSMSLAMITDKVCSLAQRAGVETSTRSYALAAALKLTAQLGSLVPSAAALISKFSTSRHVDLSQRCVEFQALSSRPQLMQRVLPVDASTEDIEVDVNMSFLNSFVAEAEAAGARAYAPPAKEEETESHANALRFDAYAKPDTNHMAAILDGTPAVPGGGFPPSNDLYVRLVLQRESCNSIYD